MKTTTEQNKRLVLEAFDTLFNKRDYAAAEKFWSPHYIQHSAHIEPGLLPEFDHAVRLHRFINRIEKASESGRRTAVADIWNVASGEEQ